MHARWLFGIAAAFNFAIAASVLFLRPWIAPLLQLDPALGTNVATANIAGVLVAAFGWAYACIARDPVRYRPAMLPAVLEKLTFAGATIVLFAQRRLADSVLGFGLVDLTFAVLFTISYLRVGRSGG